ncbi:MAG: T9SS type A sorting domain-containing protein [Saprospiraceae bacterium]|nr:T9SS type A sorting domain-containing protein [Saprospiraceae bacterium]MBP7699883.1 T9SS type A sorting domain-containing protein [Saprospiraceae bacterium]
MTHRLKFFTIQIIALWLLPLMMKAQVTISPAFPTVDDDVTIYYDATQGDGGLVGVPPPIFLHTGVITNLSTSLSDWKHVQGTWGQQNEAWQLTPLGNNQYSISYNIRDYYGIPQSETVDSLAFVFRNGDGSQTGRAAGGSDIFYPVYNPSQGFQAALLNPQSPAIIAALGQNIPVKGASSATAMLSLYDGANLLTQTTGTELNYTISASAGFHNIRFVADNGTETQEYFFSYVVPATNNIGDPPVGTKLGFNDLGNGSAIFALYAPSKQNVFLIGSFNDWSLDLQMNRSIDGTTWWVQADNLTQGNYTYQYLVDGQLHIADPYSYQVLDPYNDSNIPASTYPNIPAYPTGKTTGIVTLLPFNTPAFSWQNDGFVPPKKTDLIIYELLLRDFLASRKYQDLTDTLDYLQRLGVNAIELMPINEFENNNSWGYNSSFHYAIDKYYGTPEAFKTFVDECHARGIAVIVDVVFNHAFGQSPLAQLYWDAANNRPAANNPWLNPIPRHPFNVGNDFNHESQATKDYVNQCLKHWLEEFHIDGFRFDLSKGFTQTNNPDNVNAWGQYDVSRIAILKQYADEVWENDADAYVILEHFSANSEEKELAEYGMMLWGNSNYNFNEATMGWTSTDLRWNSYAHRGWAVPHVVSYMESHDEERLMYKNKTFGNQSATDYKVRDLAIGLQRMELASAFFYTIPGPKMLWQFGELGYDYSINTCSNGTTISSSCRLDPKPVRWDYYFNPSRLQLYEVTRALMFLKTNYEVFETTDFDITGINSSSNQCKDFHLNSATLNVTVIGNFNVTEQSMTPRVQHTGWWYDYLRGDSLLINNTTETLALKAGEYRILTDVKLPAPPTGYIDFIVDTEETLAETLGFTIAPNPSEGNPTFLYSLTTSGDVQITIYNTVGQLVKHINIGTQPSGNYAIDTQLHLPKGTYFAQLRADNITKTSKLLIH